MPIYEYICNSCGHTCDVMQKVSENALTECPECHQHALTKLVSAAGFRLKGSGWYETDFKQGDKKKNLLQSESSTQSQGESQTTSGSTSDTSGKSESSTASTSETSGSNSGTSASASSSNTSATKGSSSSSGSDPSSSTSSKVSDKTASKSSESKT